jgi:hypothetical protein
MAWIAIYYKVLASQQFEALSFRSVIDLTTCLLHDVEQALNQGLTVSLLILDVEEAFDEVLPEKLVYRLCLQGWLDILVCWIVSFMTGRSVQIRLDGEVRPIIDILCGLPQGLLISLILFMLYLVSFFQLGSPKARFSYVDKAAFLVILSTLVGNC